MGTVNFLSFIFEMFKVFTNYESLDEICFLLFLQLLSPKEKIRSVVVTEKIRCEICLTFEFELRADI